MYVRWVSLKGGCVGKLIKLILMHNNPAATTISSPVTITNSTISLTSATISTTTATISTTAAKAGPINSAG